MRAGRAFLFVTSLSVVALVVTMALVTSLQGLAADRSGKSIAAARSEIRNNSYLAEMNNAFRGVAEAVRPSVVRVEVSKRSDVATYAGLRVPEGLELPPGVPEHFRKFFGRDRDPGTPHDMPPDRVGVGSGWVYDHHGHIITNNHVVEGAEEVTVEFFDGKEFTAKVVGADPKTDVAVLKIDADALYPVALATEPVAQGDMVFAFGSPLQFDFSMSQGVVSGQHRKMGLLGPSGFENFIQTDAAINPGNSGGPLVDIRGEVVGMNTAIASRSGLFSGVGLAVPTDMIKQVVEQIIDNGEVRRGYLGIAIQDDEDLVKSFGHDGKGVLVSDTMPDLPAAKAGLERGDVITRVNGRDVTTSDDLRREIASMAPDSDVKLTVFRDGELKNFSVTLAAMPTGNVATASGGEDVSKPQKIESLAQLGFKRVRTLTPDMAKRLGLEETKGVLIEAIRPNSVVAKLGLRRGVVITEVNGTNVTTAKELAEALEDADLKKGVRMSVKVNGQHRYVFLKTDE